MTHHYKQSLQFKRAEKFFSPSKFGFKKYGIGWEKEIAGIGTVIFTPLRWEHAHLLTTNSNGKTESSFDLLSRIEQNVFGITDRRDITPLTILCTLERAGGSVIVAYRKDKGFTNEGWLGYFIGIGGMKNKYIFKSIGVRQDKRSKGIGWHLKILLAHNALKHGHTVTEWTFDPFRGANAKLNITKLGGISSKFAIEHYGNLNYDLYGNIPSDRLIVTWDLLSLKVQKRIKEVNENIFNELKLDSIQNIPQVTLSNLKELKKTLPPLVIYEIPLNLKNFTYLEEINIRTDMRKIFQTLLTTEKAFIPKGNTTDPAQVKKTETEGDYIITDFVSGKDNKGSQRNYYIFTRTLNLS